MLRIELPYELSKQSFEESVKGHTQYTMEVSMLLNAIPPGGGSKPGSIVNALLLSSLFISLSSSFDHAAL